MDRTGPIYHHMMIPKETHHFITLSCTPAQTNLYIAIGSSNWIIHKVPKCGDIYSSIALSSRARSIDRSVVRSFLRLLRRQFLCCFCWWTTLCLVWNKFVNQSIIEFINSQWAFSHIRKGNWIKIAWNWSLHGGQPRVKKNTCCDSNVHWKEIIHEKEPRPNGISPCAVVVAVAGWMNNHQSNQNAIR